MSTPDIDRLQSIKTLPSLLAYLKHDLGWPIDADDSEEVFFDYDPVELGFTSEHAAKIKEIKQLRPLDGKQPWGIFWVNFEKKALPVVMLRRILSHLVVKKRANKAAQRAWHMNDLLFISAYGDDSDRAITFAHFAHESEAKDDLPVLKVLGWDGGDTVLHLADAHRILTAQLRWPDDPHDIATWRTQWGQAFTLRNREVISTTQELVVELAKLATSIRKRVDSILARESDRGPMRRLYSAFKTALIHDLTEDDFADVIAQTISYGLLAARFSNKSAISIKSLVDMIPPTNPFLRELLSELLAVAGRKKGSFDFDELGIQDVVDLLNQANAEAVKSDFGNRTRNEDPVIHFYEHFLHAYDRQKKVQRGAFYTPTHVVSYIVRSVHELLQTEFGLEDGLADTTTWGEMVKSTKDLKIPDGAKPGDPFVLILDPATGTGTFLVEVIEVVFTHLMKKWTDLGKKPAELSKLWNEYVPKNLLPRLYGYELMMAPYTIAHMKLALKLQEISARLGQSDFQFRYTDRAHIYLTNSLEKASDLAESKAADLFAALGRESHAVNTVKLDKRFTVVIGNPPYAVEGVNKNEWIDGLMDVYREDVRSEHNIQLLSDDYAKFLRFADHAITIAGHGIMAMITKNTYLNTTAFRGLRKHLLSSFQVNVLDLHGKLYGKTPAGDSDTNVFEIRVGVAVIFARRICALAEHDTFCHQELFGLGEAKCTTLSQITFSSTGWQKHPIDVAQWILEPLAHGEADEMSMKEYACYTPLLDLAVGNLSSVSQGKRWGGGVKTNRDFLLVALSKEELEHRLEMLSSRSVDTAKVKNQLGLVDGRYWDTERERKKLGMMDWRRRLFPYLYGPFEVRHVAHIPTLIEIGRGGASKHLMLHYQAAENVGLVLKRRNLDDEYHHVFVTRHTSDINCLGGQTYTIPLLLVDDDFDLFELSGERTRESNFIVGRDLFAQLLGNRDVSVTDVFQYVYTLLHSPVYRSRYGRELRKDFPRLPLTSNLDLFRTLAKLGRELVALHLMESPRLEKIITNWVGSKHPEVEKIAYSDETVWIDKAQSTGFSGVPESVWNFHIGGYQVCEKWLKDRKGRTLTKDDIEHYHRIVVALSETIRLMAEIDQVIEKHGGWPGAFVTDKSAETPVAMPVGRRASSKKPQCEPEFL